MKYSYRGHAKSRKKWKPKIIDSNVYQSRDFAGDQDTLKYINKIYTFKKMNFITLILAEKEAKIVCLMYLYN